MKRVEDSYVVSLEWLLNMNFPFNKSEKLMTTERPLNHANNSLNTPSIELEGARQKRNTYLEKKYLHDSEGECLS